MTKQSFEIYERLLRRFAPRSDKKCTGLMYVGRAKDNINSRVRRFDAPSPAFTLSCKSSLSSLSLLPGFVFSALSSLRLSHNRARSLRSTPPCAFTLAETLIALVIIGIIAAITVPIIITEQQKQETLQRLKKAYSVLNNAVKLSKFDNGPYAEWEKGADVTDIYAYFDKYWKPYFSHVQLVYGDARKLGYKSNSPWKNLNGNTIGWAMGTMQSRILFTLNDGTVVFIPLYSNINYPENIIYVDINASKKPNVLGKDVFLFRISDEKNIIPYTGSCTRQSGTNYNGCTAKIINDGWQFKSDYPW